LIILQVRDPTTNSLTSNVKLLARYALHSSRRSF